MPAPSYAQPGDAVVVYGGRENWDKVNPLWGSNVDVRPGLHASCLKFIRESDCSLLVWDMMDFLPNGYGIPWTVHGAIFAYGIGLLDNALLQPLAEACAEEGRYEFMLVVAPPASGRRHRLAGQPYRLVLTRSCGLDIVEQQLRQEILRT